MLPISGIEHLSKVIELSSKVDPRLDAPLSSPFSPAESPLKENPEGFSEYGWSNNVVTFIRNEAECKIYKDAGLIEGEVGGNTALMNPTIGWEQMNPVMRYTAEEFNTLFFRQLPIDFESIKGLAETNRERALQGYAPLDNEGHAIELHHVGQKVNSPLAELTSSQHDLPGLHDNTIKSEVHTAQNDWSSQKKQYWIERAKAL